MTKLLKGNVLLHQFNIAINPEPLVIDYYFFHHSGAYQSHIISSHAFCMMHIFSQPTITYPESNRSEMLDHFIFYPAPPSFALN
jgi:hypothetical protein